MDLGQASSKHTFQPLVSLVFSGLEKGLFQTGHTFQQQTQKYKFW